MTAYECDKCGACCQGHLIVEADELDVLRSPQIVDADPDHCGKPLTQVIHELQHGSAVVLAAGRLHPCSFLGKDNHCMIYQGRPNCCVGMQAGDEQCQDARNAAGLPPLQPTAAGMTCSECDTTIDELGMCVCDDEMRVAMRVPK